MFTDSTALCDIVSNYNAILYNFEKNKNINYLSVFGPSAWFNLEIKNCNFIDYDNLDATVIFLWIMLSIILYMIIIIVLLIQKMSYSI